MTNICPSDSYTGSGPDLPAVTYLCTDHPILSPSGVYVAELQDDGNFVEWRGSQPLVNNNLAWSLGMMNGKISNPNGGPGAFVAVIQNDGNFVIYGPNNINSFWQATNSNQSGMGNYVASLADNGAFTISNTGTGQQIFINKINNNAVNNPVKSTNVTSLNYDFADQTVGLPTQVLALKHPCINNTGQTATCGAGITLNYIDTNSFSWSESSTLTIGISSTVNLPIPGLTPSLEFSVESSSTFENGQSTEATVEQTYTNMDTITVPPNSTYELDIFGQRVEGMVPFDWTGTATYQGGQTAFVDGMGIFDGVGETDFTTEFVCISTPGGCPPPLEIPPTPAVPEPSSALLLPMFMLVTAVAARLRLMRRARRLAGRYAAAARASA